MNSERPHFNPKSSTQERGEAAVSPQEVVWKNIRADVDNITDRLGCGIDEKIKEAVTAFQAHEFTTSQSCEGHIGEEGHGFPFPWVEVEAPEPKEWETAKGEKRKGLDREWAMRNLAQQQKMIDFLAEFYRGRETQFDARLFLQRAGGFGGFRVQSFGAEVIMLLSPEEQLAKLELYRKEMVDFAGFLKGKYLSKE